jgi:hypothetical protein
LQQPFFFLIAPASPFLFDRAKSADSLIDANQVFAGFPEPMELRDLVLRLAQRSRIREGFGYALAGDSPGQTELRVMTGIIGFGAMARRLTAATHYRLWSNRAAGRQGGGNLRGVWIGRLPAYRGYQAWNSFLNVIIRSERWHKNRKAAYATSTSHTPRQAAIAIASGVVLGLAGAMLLTRFVSSEIWEVKATDPATFAAVTLVLIGIAILACLIPARRAVGMDPNIALRHE